MGRDSGEKTAKQQERRNIVTHRSSTECQVPICTSELANWISQRRRWRQCFGTSAPNNK